jgi:RNase P subunit RPR2
MKTKLSKTEAQQKIFQFFQRENFSPEEVRKIKKLAMGFNIKLGNYRKKFCKKCCSKLKGKIRIMKTHKIVECENCGYKNKFRLASLKHT